MNEKKTPPWKPLCFFLDDWSCVFLGEMIYWSKLKGRGRCNTYATTPTTISNPKPSLPVLISTHSTMPVKQRVRYKCTFPTLSEEFILLVYSTRLRNHGGLWVVWYAFMKPSNVWFLHEEDDCAPHNGQIDEVQTINGATLYYRCTETKVRTVLPGVLREPFFPNYVTRCL